MNPSFASNNKVPKVNALNNNCDFAKSPSAPPALILSLKFLLSNCAGVLP